MDMCLDDVNILLLTFGIQTWDRVSSSPIDPIDQWKSLGESLLSFLLCARAHTHTRSPIDSDEI